MSPSPKILARRFSRQKEEKIGYVSFRVLAHCIYTGKLPALYDLYLAAKLVTTIIALCSKQNKLNKYVVTSH